VSIPAAAVTERSSRSPRWGFLGRHWVRVGGELFLDRRQLVQTPWFSLLLTRIHGPDEGRDPHDHSRWFASFALTGGYDETVWTDPAHLSRTRVRSHRAGSVHVMRAEHAHLITSVRGPLRTLVIAGRHRGTWSFWTPQGKVDWREYRAGEAA
jgi:hypothetical protein